MNINEGKYYRIVLWILEGLATIGFIYLVIYFISAYSNYEILKNVPNDFKRGGDNNYLNPNEQGDTLGGILNPIIGIVAILVTYLAFFIQFLANKQVQNQFKVQQFESQFYEMLRIHKDNVNEMHLSTKDGKFDGRFALELMYNELVFSYNLCKDLIKTHVIMGSNPYKFQSDKSVLIFVYRFWFYGINGVKKDYFDRLENLCLKALEDQQSSKKQRDEIPQIILKGHQFRIAHYYRHLFQTVKFIVSENEKFITYKEKRKYLRILRAQLSNHEQALLFFNWYSDFGHSWEEKGSGNKFFTDYRMIHNLYPELILNIYDLNLLKSDKKESEDLKDNIFDFQDWNN